jgi:hypothetical protein
MVRRPQESDASYPIPLNGISTLGESSVEVFVLEPTKPAEQSRVYRSHRQKARATLLQRQGS